MGTSIVYGVIWGAIYTLAFYLLCRPRHSGVYWSVGWAVGLLSIAFVVTAFLGFLISYYWYPI